MAALSVRSGDSDRAATTLRQFTERPPRLSALTRANVDDLLWAIRQINERNALVAEVLGQNDTACLSPNDVGVLQESHEAVRRVYLWVAGATDANGLNRKAHMRTLSGIAESHNVTIRALRHLNPELDDFRADDILPDGHQVRVPAQSIATRGEDGEKARGSVEKKHGRDGRHRSSDARSPSSSHRRDRKAAATDLYETVTERSTLRTQRHETLQDIADARGITVDELRDENASDLDEYSDTESLPRGKKIFVTATRRVRRRDGDHSDTVAIDVDGDSYHHRRPRNHSDERRSDDDDDDDRRHNRDHDARKRQHRGGDGSEPHQQRRRRVSEDGVYHSLQGDTLRTLANEVFRCTLPVLRVANPELNRVGDYHVLPTNTPVYANPPLRNGDDEVELHRRRRSTRDTEDGDRRSFSSASSDDGRRRHHNRRRRHHSRSPSRRAESTPVATRRHHDGDRDARKAGDGGAADNFAELRDERAARGERPVLETQGRETLGDVASELGLPVRDVLHYNEHLRSYNAVYRLPPGIPVYGQSTR
jgi:hypothetical protein